MMYDGMPRAIAMETYAKLPVIASIFHASGGIAVPVPATNDEARMARQGKASSAKVAPADASERGLGQRNLRFEEMSLGEQGFDAGGEGVGALAGGA